MESSTASHFSLILNGKTRCGVGCSAGSGKDGDGLEMRIVVVMVMVEGTVVEAAEMMGKVVGTVGGRVTWL